MSAVHIHLSLNLAFNGLADVFFLFFFAITDDFQLHQDRSGGGRFEHQELSQNPYSRAGVLHRGW